MKPSRSYFFIAISSISLVAVLAIQVNWILDTAHIKEQLFNEKANMVLSRTVEDVQADQQTCQQLGQCIGKTEIQTIDSLLAKNMAFYNFYMDYSFELLQPDKTIPAEEPDLNSNVFKKRLDEVVSQNGLELKLVFPRKEQFILAEIGLPFFSSVFLIVVVLILSWRTILSLQKQKMISEHTTDFLNNMTHELKTPLTTISLAGKMILKETHLHDEEKLRHYSGIILHENEKLRQQVEQVLSMTALERGEIPLQKKHINLHDIIATAVQSIHIQLENRSGKLEQQLLASHAQIKADPLHLGNALVNLLENAIKYSPGSPEIQIQTSNQGNYIQLVIADKGLGIDKKYHRRIFDNYFRVPTGDVHDVKGFGMGLSYTKTVIEMHGGNISLSSEKTKGTTFILQLPYVD